MFSSKLRSGMQQILSCEEQAVKAGAEFIAGSARQHHIPGSSGIRAVNEHIRESITAEVQRESDGYFGKISCKAAHGVYVEYGTGMVGAASGGNGSGQHVTYTMREGWTYPVEGYNGTEFYYTEGQPAQPFMYPAFQEAKTQLLQIIAQNF